MSRTSQSLHLLVPARSEPRSRRCKLTLSGSYIQQGLRSPKRRQVVGRRLAAVNATQSNNVSKQQQPNPSPLVHPLTLLTLLACSQASMAHNEERMRASAAAERLLLVAEYEGQLAAAAGEVEGLQQELQHRTALMQAEMEK